MSYELSYAEHGFVVRFHGNVTIDELNIANGELQGHAQFDNHRFQIIDLLAADLATVTEEDAEFPAVTDSIASRTNWGVKVAFVVTDSYAVNIVNSYMTYARQLTPKWEFGIFATYDAALEWAAEKQPPHTR